VLQSRRMAHPKVGDELDALLKRREKLEAKIKEAQARQKEQERIEEEKRRTIAGTIFLTFLESNPDSDLSRQLVELLNQQLTKSADRELFPALSGANGSPKVSKSD